jgi:DNA-binding XRE family transcriptional regulator
MERQFRINWPAIVEEAKQRRKSQKLTQQRLGELAGVSTPTISHFERGDFGPIAALVSISRPAWKTNQTTAASSIRVATRLTIVRLPWPEFETLLVVTRFWLSSSATSRRTAEGSRARTIANALNVTGSVEISRNRRTRAGVITSKKSAGSSKER